MSRLFASGGQSIGASASASVLPMNIRDWFPLGLTGLISWQFKGLSLFWKYILNFFKAVMLNLKWLWKCFLNFFMFSRIEKKKTHINLLQSQISSCWRKKLDIWKWEGRSKSCGIKLESGTSMKSYTHTHTHTHTHKYRFMCVQKLVHTSIFLSSVLWENLETVTSQ